MYLSLNSGGPNAGQVDGLVFSRVELNHHGISVDHLHHLEGQKKREEELSKIKIGQKLLGKHNAPRRQETNLRVQKTHNP